jgi:hypothetical protein
MVRNVAAAATAKAAALMSRIPICISDQQRKRYCSEKKKIEEEGSIEMMD